MRWECPQGGSPKREGGRISASPSNVSECTDEQEAGRMRRWLDLEEDNHFWFGQQDLAGCEGRAVEEKRPHPES